MTSSTARHDDVDAQPAPGTTGRRRHLVTAAVAVATVGALLVLANAVTRFQAVAAQTSGWIVSVPVWPTTALPDSAWDPPSPLTDRFGVAGSVDGVDLWLNGTDASTAAMAGAAQWAAWPVVGLAVLVLLPVLRGLVGGRPFARRDAWHVLGVAGLVVVGWAAAYGLPALAARRVLADPAVGVPETWLRPVFRPEWWPLWFAAAIVALAFAVRRAARAADDTEGLV